MKSIKIILPIVFPLCCLLQAYGQPGMKIADKIVGIVGDHIVLLSDIEMQFQQLLEEDEKVPTSVKCDILEQMMLQKMFIQHAEIDSVTVSDQEIEGELDRRIRYFVSMVGSEEMLEKYYEKSILQIKDEFRKDIADQLLSQRMQGKIFENVRVTPAEVKAFFQAIPKDSVPFFNAEVEVGQLVIKPKVDRIQRQLAIEKIEGILARIRQGEDFNKMAIIYSEDGSAPQGGDLGFFGRGQMVSEFEAVAFRLDPGEVSDIIQTQFGYHLIRVMERKGEKVRAQHILIKPKITSYDLQIARQKIDSVRTLLVEGKLNFAEAVMQFSDDEESKVQAGMLVNPQTGNNFFEVNQLDKEIYFAIDKLSAGEFSAPSLFMQPDGNQAYRILYLKSETEAHQANLRDDYSKIKAATLNKKQAEAMAQWMEDKIKETYIRLDPSYQDCDALKKWFDAQYTIQSRYESTRK